MSMGPAKGEELGLLPSSGVRRGWSGVRVEEDLGRGARLLGGARGGEGRDGGVDALEHERELVADGAGV
jgi:hypothetical protein